MASQCTQDRPAPKLTAAVALDHPPGDVTTHRDKAIKWSDDHARRHRGADREPDDLVSKSALDRRAKACLHTPSN